MKEEVKNCANPDEVVDVKVNVDVSRIIKYLCAAGVLIVSIVYGYKVFLKIYNKRELE